MTDIYTVADNLIRQAKRDESLKSVRFIKAYRKADAQRPVSGFLAVVNLNRVERRADEQGDIYKTELEITIHNSEANSGEELSIIALSLMNALKNADEKGFISDISVGSISYDNNNGAIRRSVKAELSTILINGEMKKYPLSDTQGVSVVSAAAVYKDGVKLSGVKSLSVSEEYENTRSCYEILSDEPWFNPAQKKKYIIELTLSENSYIGSDSNFELAAECGTERIIYKSCRVISLEINVRDSENIIKKIKISAGDKESVR